MMEWSEKYSTGIEDIDKQHRALFKFFAFMEKKIKEKDSTIIKDTLCFLETYIVEHFKFEEMCMLGTNCPEAENNKKEHDLFIIQLREFNNKVKTSPDPLEVMLEINHFVKNWLVNHISKTDAELKKYWKSPAQQPPPLGEEYAQRL
ncbi:MAG: hemerythrin family protein [Candidatus Omnitrophica bacterium]|nr:hemerythrin family protein [Candidatus Omnitrophota bacterium]